MSNPVWNKASAFCYTHTSRGADASEWVEFDQTPNCLLNTYVGVCKALVG